jgi:hypothetical protein
MAELGDHLAESGLAAAPFVALRASVAPARLSGGVRERTLPLALSNSRLGAPRKTKNG